MSNTPTIERTIKNIQAETGKDVYYCPECHSHRVTSSWLVNYETGNPACSDCGVDAQFSHRTPAAWVSIAAYCVARKYGGPEEGGWWYDAKYREDCTIRCFEQNDLEEAAKYVHKLRKEWVKVDNPVSARYVVEMFGDKLPVRNLPEERPTYS